MIKYDAKIDFRLPSEVKRKWQIEAKELDLNMCDFIRMKVENNPDIITHKPPKTRVKGKPKKYTNVSPELTKQLSGIGNNINQISRNLQISKYLNDKNSSIYDIRPIYDIRLLNVLIDIERDLKEIMENYSCPTINF